MEEEPEGSGLASEPAPPQPGQAGAASNAGSAIAADAAPRASKTRTMSNSLQRWQPTSARLVEAQALM